MNSLNHKTLKYSVEYDKISSLSVVMPNCRIYNIIYTSMANSYNNISGTPDKTKYPEQRKNIEAGKHNKQKSQPECNNFDQKDFHVFFLHRLNGSSCIPTLINFTTECFFSIKLFKPVLLFFPELLQPFP